MATLKVKASHVSGVVPSSLAPKELAINTADKAIWVGNTTAPVLLFSSSGSSASPISTLASYVNTTATVIDSIPLASGLMSVEYTISCQDVATNSLKSTKIHALIDGTTPLSTEYATIVSNASNDVATFTTDISGGNFRLLATAIPANVMIRTLKSIVANSTSNGTIANFHNSSASSITIQETEIDIPKPSTSYVSVITDASVSPTSKIITSQSGANSTGGFADENEFTDLAFSAYPGSGNFTLVTKCLNGLAYGKFKVNYIVG